MGRVQVRVEEQQRADGGTCPTPMVGDGLVPSANGDRRLSKFERPVLRKAAIIFVHRLRTKDPDRPIVSDVR